MDEFLTMPLDELIDKYRIEYDDEIQRIYCSEDNGDNEQFTAVEKYTRATDTNRNDDPR